MNLLLVIWRGLMIPDSPGIPPPTSFLSARDFSMLGRVVFPRRTTSSWVSHQDVRLLSRTRVIDADPMLMPTDVLNILNPAFERKLPVRPEDFRDPDPRKQAENVRCLAKYVFPRQYGLSSPFAPGPWPKQDGFKFPDYTDRSHEIEA
jgi:hypothetical protein